MTESELQDFVIGLARQFGWLVMHARTVRIQRASGSVYYETPLQGDPGFPDLVLAKEVTVLFRELKQDGKYPDPNQRAWLEAVGGKVWRPKDIPEIERILSGGRIQ